MNVGDIDVAVAGGGAADQRVGAEEAVLGGVGFTELVDELFALLGENAVLQV